MPFGASKVTMLGAAGGGSDPSWVMEVIAATNAGTHANFYISDVRTNPHDGKTYIAGMWDNYYSSGYYNDYGPLVGQLKDDGTADLEWWTMNWYNSATYRTIGRSQYVFFAAGSSDVYVSSRFERGSTGVMWARYNSSGTLQNTSNFYTVSRGNGKMDAGDSSDGMRVVYAGDFPSSYTRYLHGSWPYDSSTTIDKATLGYENWFANAQGPDDGAHYYTNGSTYGYNYSFMKDYYYGNGMINVGTPNAENWQASKVWSGISNPGCLAKKGDGDNTAGLSFSSYPTHHGMLAANVSSVSWSKTLTASSGSIQISGYNGPHIDTDGNVYAFGQDNSKGFIIKYNSSGTVQWQRHFSVTIGGSSASSEIDSVTTNEDGSIVYFNMYVGNLQYGGSGTSKFPRMVLWKIKADGSETGSYTVDNSSGTGSGDTDVYTIAASSITVNTGTVSLSSSDTPSNQGVSKSFENQTLYTTTPWSSFSNKPIMASADIS